VKIDCFISEKGSKGIFLSFGLPKNLGAECAVLHV
jgi:hypothetical protein